MEPLKADIIIHNGTIYKSDIKGECAEAAAIKNDKFICVGTREECEKFKGETTRLYDAKDRLILPGLIDGHTHPETITNSRWCVQMPEFDDMRELLSFVKAYCEEHPVNELPFFFGECYPSTMFDEKDPRKEWIDEYVSDRPVRLQDFTDHACWYNSKALELMGIDKNGKKSETAPFIVRDENNEPTGWVLEPIPTSGMEERMFDRIDWHPPTEVTEETITPFLDFLNDCGVIAIYDGITETENAMKLFYDMDMNGRLNMYYEGMCLLEEYGKLEQCVATNTKGLAKKIHEQACKDTYYKILSGWNR